MTEAFGFADYVEVYMQQNRALPEERDLAASFILPEEGVTFGGQGSLALSLMPDSRLLGTMCAEAMVPSKKLELDA